MDFTNSRNINNRIKKTTIVVAEITHIVLAIVTFGLSLLLLSIVGIATLLLLNKEIDEASSRENNFNKNFPFGYLVAHWAAFSTSFITPIVLSRISIPPLKQNSKGRLL